MVLNILKEADINFLFKVLAKFGDYKEIIEIVDFLIFFNPSLSLACWGQISVGLIHPIFYFFKTLHKSFLCGFYDGRVHLCQATVGQPQ